jgi:hypothetical protein
MQAVPPVALLDLIREEKSRDRLPYARPIRLGETTDRAHDQTVRLDSTENELEYPAAPTGRGAPKPSLPLT